MKQLIESLLQMDAVEARGWFRWLHNHFLGRYRTLSTRLEESAPFEALHQIEQSWKEVSFDQLFDCVPAIEKHAWLVGRLGLHNIIAACWSGIQPSARGAILAALTEADIPVAPASCCRRLQE